VPRPSPQQGGDWSNAKTGVWFSHLQGPFLSIDYKESFAPVLDIYPLKLQNYMKWLTSAWTSCYGQIFRQEAVEKPVSLPVSTVHSLYCINKHIIFPFSGSDCFETASFSCPPLCRSLLFPYRFWETKQNFHWRLQNAGICCNPAGTIVGENHFKSAGGIAAASHKCYP